MPNRIIKESIRTSKSVNAMSDFQFRLWVYLITYVDDFGRGSADPELLKGFVFPRRKGITEDTIRKTLAELAIIGSVILYEVDGEPYLCFPNWSEHQTVRNKVSKYPSPEDGIITSASNCKQLKSIESKCPRNPIQSESNPNPKESNARETRFTPPSISDVEQYCREKGYHINAERFVCFYAQKGWMVGKNRMKDWKRAVQGWETRWKDEQKNAQHGFSYDYGSTEDSL